MRTSENYKCVAALLFINYTVYASTLLYAAICPLPILTTSIWTFDAGVFITLRIEHLWLLRNAVTMTHHQPRQFSRERCFLGGIKQAA